MTNPTRLGSALVTGATSRIGAAIVRALAPRSDRLLIHHHQSDPGALVAELARTAGLRVDVLREDLAAPDGPARLGAAARALAPSLDLVVHNAGLYHHAPLEETEATDIDRLYAVNQRAPLLLTRALLPALRAARGQVVFLGDVGGVIPWKHHAGYGATKAAVAWWVRALALELAPDVRVNGVAPGLVSPPAGMDATEVDRLVRRIPLRRLGDPVEVAEAVAWFAVAAGYVTGQVLNVDGGRAAGRAD